MVGVNVEPKPNPLAIEVLCYMAYETVAEVTMCGILLMALSYEWRIEKYSSTIILWRCNGINGRIPKFRQYIPILAVAVAHSDRA